MIPVLNPALLERLTNRLDAAVRGEPSVGPARAQLLAPLRLLGALGDEAGRALGDDQMAVERLRLLAASGNGHGGALALLRAMIPEEGGDLSSAAPGANSVSAPPAGLIHPGSLVIVALAAGRAGRQVGVGGSLVDNVLGVALAASPAEAVSRALGNGLSDDGLLAVLSGLLPRDATDSRFAGTVAAFLADPSERQRWTCLSSLFAEVQRDVAKTQWEATAEVSLAIPSPKPACGGSPVALALSSIGSDDVGSSVDPDTLLTLLVQQHAQVVFASGSGSPLVASIASVDRKKRTITVTVPNGARSGWIGIAVEQLRLGTNRQRAALRRKWLRLGETVPCLISAPVPVEAIVALEAPTSPPRAGSPRFTGGVPSVMEFSAHPDLVGAGESFELRWQVDGAATIELEPGPGKVESPGSLVLKASDQRRTLGFTLSATSSCGVVERETAVRVRVGIRGLEITQGGRTGPLVRGQPLDLRVVYTPADAAVTGVLRIAETTIALEGGSGVMTGTIPAGAAVTGLSGRVALMDLAGAVEDEQELGPLTLTEPRVRKVVLVRPPLLGDEFLRVTASEARAAIQLAERAAGVVAEVREPVWVNDEDLFLDGGPGELGTPGTMAILERLGVLAARHPGFESAAWVAVVPNQGEQPIAAIAPADAALLVAVCTPDRLAAVLAQTTDGEPAGTSRLRAVGLLEPNGSFQSEPAAVEVRGAGLGSTFDTGLEASVLDDLGNVQVRMPVRAVRNGLPARLVALVPVSPDSAAVELHLEVDPGFSVRQALRVKAVGNSRERAFATDPVVAHFRRPEGKPAITAVRLEGSTLRWSFAHPMRARSWLWIEVRRGGVWFPTVPVGECQTALTLPLQRLGPGEEGDRVRVVATDGWHRVAEPEDGLDITGIPSIRLVARRARTGRLWADVEIGGDDPGAGLSWQAGSTSGTGVTFDPPAGFEGEVTLTARIGSLVLTDTRPAPPVSPGRRRAGALAVHG